MQRLIQLGTTNCLRWPLYFAQLPIGLRPYVNARCSTTIWSLQAIHRILMRFKMPLSSIHHEVSRIRLKQSSTMESPKSKMRSILHLIRNQASPSASMKRTNRRLSKRRAGFIGTSRIHRPRRRNLFSSLIDSF
jgi:hypothetical protein